MAVTSVSYTGNGNTAAFNISFDYQDTSDVKVTVDNTPSTAFTVLGSTLTFNSAPSNGAAIRIFRDTYDTNLRAIFQSGSAIRAEDLNKDNTQLLYLTQESNNTAADALTTAETANTTANTANTTANTANATANAANTTANQALNTANASIALSKNVTAYNPFQTVANLPSPSDGYYASVADSTGIENLATLSGLPNGFVGNSDLSVRLVGDGTQWIWVDYYANDPDSRYQQIIADDNAYTDAEKTKLAGIEAGATADQTASEIRTLVDAASDSNVFTDADHSKLDGIEAGATADQTAAEIRTLVGNASDSNVFTDADHTKLNGIESGATADQTKADIDALNIDADTLDGLHASSFLNSSDTGTGDMSTNGNIQSGRGSGGVALTINDGKGNANVTFNHENGVPEQGGNAARIEVNTDSTSNATMYFEGRSFVTGGVSYDLNDWFTMSDSGATCLGNTVWHAGNMGDESGLDADLLDGQHSGYFLNASNLNAGTIPDARIADIGDSSARIINFDNLEKGNLSNDGDLGFDSSQGLLLYRTQQGVALNPTAVTVLDGANVLAGSNISISNTGGGGTNSQTFTFSVNTTNLDADLLDGQHGSYYRNASNINAGTLATARLGSDVCKSGSGFTKSLGNVTFQDNVRLQFGSSGLDSYVMHNGSNLILDVDTGQLEVNNHVEMQDNFEIRLGTSADFRMDFDGTNTVFRNYAHSGGDIIFQGEDSGGNNENLLILDTSGTRGYVRLFENNAERLKTTSGGVTVTGTVTATAFSGSGSSVTSINASNISSGTISDARLPDTIGRTTFNAGVKITGTFNDTQTTHLVLQGADPTISFSDNTSGADDFYIHVNANNFYVLTDRGGGAGAWETPHPMQLEADTNDAYMFGRRIIDNGQFSVNGTGNFSNILKATAFQADDKGVTEPSFSFKSDTNTGFYRGASDRINISTGGAYRGFMSGNEWRYIGIYNTTTGGGTNVRVDSNGRLRRHSSSRRTKTNIEPMEVEYAYKILDEVEPIWYRPRVPDPEWPQAYLDSLPENEAPCISDCEAYCQDNEIDWEIGDKWMNEGNNPDWSYWGFIAEDLAEIDPRLCQRNPETGEYDSVQYDEFTPLLLKIAQEQKKQISSLEERLSQLEARIAQLETP